MKGWQWRVNDRLAAAAHFGSVLGTSGRRCVRAGVFAPFGRATAVCAEQGGARVFEHHPVGSCGTDGAVAGHGASGWQLLSTPPPHVQVPKFQFKAGEFFG